MGITGKEMLPTHRRRQIARDFICDIVALRHAVAYNELRLACCALVFQQSADPWIACVYRTLRARAPVDQILCWGLLPWDLHPNEESELKRQKMC
jgi:hypothetical protein